MGLCSSETEMDNERFVGFFLTFSRKGQWITTDLCFIIIFLFFYLK